MTSLKCPQCGLVNFATAPTCKRCQLPFSQSSSEASRPAYHPQDSYSSQLPPQGFTSSRYGFNDDQGEVWREGSLLVMSESANLPDRCVRCNAPASEQLKRKLIWYPRYIILVFIFIRLIGLILYFMKRKRATIHVGLCEAHLNRRRLGQQVCGVLVALGFLLLYVAFNGYNVFILFGGLSMLTGIITFSVLCRTVTAHKIDDDYIWLKGVDRNFLEDLPPMPGYAR